MDDNPRVGYRDERGVRWPERTLAGGTYNRPPSTTLDIGGGYFVVVPQGMNAAAVEEAVAALKPAEVLKQGRGRKNEPDLAEDNE